MAEKRRLPVLKSDSAESEPKLPLWQWSALGVALSFALWIPLAALAQAAANRLVAQAVGGMGSGEELAQAAKLLTEGEQQRLSAQFLILHVAALSLSTFGGGYVVGKYGGDGSVKAAVGCGILVAAFGATLAMWIGALGAAALIIGLISTPMSWWGGYTGARRRSA